MNRQKGFGLLEILITLVLLGVGVAGLVSMSKGMLEASQDGRRYEIAMRLAESRIDNFRNFNVLVDPVAPETAYVDIAGGNSSQTVGQGANASTYTLSWTVNNEYWSGSAWQASAPSGYTLSYPGRKVVNVTVTWSDNQGQSRFLQLAGVIASTESLSSNELNGGLDTTRPKPAIAYTPGTVPDVVSVALGNGSKKETSKPLPKIKSGNSGSRLIQFDTVTYQATGTNNTQKSRQDIATAYCSCSTSNTGKAYLPDSPYYSSVDKAQYWTVGEQVDKSIGALSGNANQQESLCPSCCREHYDTTTKGFSGYYSPLNLTRAKYRLSGSNLQAVTSGDYIDACRFVRIDGFYRPAPDWRLVALTTFSSGFLSNATNLANYQSYLTYVVKEHAKWQKTAFSGKTDSNWSVPSSSPSIQTFNAWLTANQANSSTALSTPVGTVQLISRGIYVDIMSPSYLTNEVFKGGATEPDLAKVPFQDVNMTLLSEWSSSDSNKGSVTSQPIATIVDTDNNYYGTYSRGRLTANSTTFSGATDSPITITTKSYQGNSGVVGTPISQSDIDGIVTTTLQVSIQAPAQLPTTNINGVIKCLDLKTTTTGTGNNKVTVNSAVSCTNTSKNLNKTVSNSNVTCVVQDIGSPAEASYSCSGPAGSFFTLALDKNKYQFSPASQSFTLPGSGTLAGGCVLMVSDDLKNANPAPSPAIPTSCNIQP